jgi:hypothetical protein
MRSPFPFRTTGVSIVLLAVAACRESTAPDPGAGLEDALVQVASAEVLAAPGVALMGGIAAPASTGPNACTFSASSRRFECPEHSNGGFTIDRYYELLDASGAPRSEWSTSVVAIRNVADVSANLTLDTPPPLGPVSLVLSAHDESTLSGLQSPTQTITGTSTSNTTTTSGLGTRVANSTRSMNLTMPPRGSSSVYPTGTITMTSVANGQPNATTVTMTYNGTPIVLMTMQGGMTVHCTFDLSTPGVPPVCDL